jgi:hypothetical protein
VVSPIARALFGRLFDNAAMYPPAQAPMEASIALHDAAERAPWGFARGRFLCPGARLEDLAHELRILGRDRTALRVGAVIGSPADVNERPQLEAVVKAINHLRLSTPSVNVDLFEVRPPSPDPAELARSMGEAIDAAASSGADTLFLEVGVVGSEPSLISDRVAAVAEAGAGAGLRIGVKVRCGGLQPAMVPSRDELAAFLVAARTAGLPFKATAGLHHAFADHEGTRHGFVSLLLASVLSNANDLDQATTAKLLATSTPENLELTDDEIVLTLDGARLRADVDAVTNARYRGFVAFGTCSFTEPAFDAARLLEDTA